MPEGQLPAICKLPKNLYIFYKFEPQYNESRFKGEIYLPNALQFNDPLDCRIEVNNNIKEKTTEFKEDGWLDRKLRELDYRGLSNRKEIAEKLLNDDRETVNEVWKKQVEKMGILCLTPKKDNLLMWGYYTKNYGYCIEYNTKTLIHDLVIGYVNAMDYDMTQFLYKTRGYNSVPTEMNPLTDYQKAIAEHYANLFTEDDVDLIENDWLRNNDQGNKRNKLNFLLNILSRRMGAEYIRYDAERHPYPPNLFFVENKESNDKESIISKYYRKNSIWEHENEFRITLSLGGMKLIKLLSPNWIKSIRLGCYMDQFSMLQIAYLIYKNNLKNIPVFRMIKNDMQGLDEIKVNFSKLKRSLSTIDKEMKRISEIAM